MTPDAVIKVGGSLLGDGDLRPLLSTLEELASAGHRLVVVPGGGPFADTVRHACDRHEPGENHAHWMAVLAMDQHAHLLAGLAPNIRLTRDPNEITTTLRAGRLVIVAPFAWLRATDPLPHSWDVTSDSIAAWITARLAAPRLVLLKTVDGVIGPDGELIAEVPRSALGRVREVDPWLVHALEPSTSCWILNGRHPARLRDLLRSGHTRGTWVR